MVPLLAPRPGLAGRGRVRGLLFLPRAIQFLKQGNLQRGPSPSSGTVPPELHYVAQIRFQVMVVLHGGITLKNRTALLLFPRLTFSHRQIRLERPQKAGQAANQTQANLSRNSRQTVRIWFVAREVFGTSGGDRIRLGHARSGWRAVVDQLAT